MIERKIVKSLHNFAIVLRLYTGTVQLQAKLSEDHHRTRAEQFGFIILATVCTLLISTVSGLITGKYIAANLQEA